MDFSLKQGDTAPSYTPTLTDARSTTWDLTGAAVKFSMRRLADGVLVIDHRTCTVLDAANRIVRLDWQAGDTAVVGLYLGEFEVTLVNTRIETFPDNGHVLIQVTAAADLVTFPTTLCSVDDIAGYLDNLTATEAVFAARTIIPGVEAQAETFLQHALVQKERTESAIPLYPSQVEIPLRWTPVKSISIVSIDGTTVPPIGYIAERMGAVLSYIAPPLSLTLPVAAVTVTYVAGLDTIDTDHIKPTLASRMARLLMKYRDKALGTDSVNAESYTVKYMSEGFTDDEKEALDPYRNRSSGLYSRNVDEEWSTRYEHTWAPWS